MTMRMTTAPATPATSLRFYQLAFAVLPDGHVCVVDDADLPSDRMTVSLPSGLMRVLEEPNHREEDQAEADALAEPIPSADAIAAAVASRIGGAPRDRVAPGSLAFFSLFLARLPDGDVRAIDVCDIPEEAWANHSGNAHCACRNASDPFGRYDGRYASEAAPTPEEVAEAVRRATRKAGA